MTSFDQYISGLVEQVAPSNIKRDIEHLSSYLTRFTLSNKIVPVSQWIHKQFTTRGYSDVEYQDFVFCNTLQKNIVCTKTGKGQSNKIIILCAHYDTIARSTIGWNWKKCPAPGANDNASGVAAMLEIARILMNVEMDYTIRFIAFTGEEQNLMGSRAYAEYARTNNMDIILVLNLDEIGYPDVKSNWNINIGVDQVNRTHTKKATAHKFALLMAKVAADNTSLNSRRIGLWASDHTPFSSRGYAVIGITQAGKYPHSHKITDTVNYIDVDYIVEVTKMTLATLIHIAGCKGRQK